MKFSSKALVIYRKKILLIQRDNIPGLREANKWSIPGGNLEKNETHKQALKRELQEEINVVPSNINYLSSVGFLLLKQYFYLIRLTKEEFKKVKLGNEGQKIGWFKVDELKNIEMTAILTEYFNKYIDQLRGVVEKK